MPSGRTTEVPRVSQVAPSTRRCRVRVRPVKTGRPSVSGRRTRLGVVSTASVKGSPATARPGARAAVGSTPATHTVRSWALARSETGGVAITPRLAGHHAEADPAHRRRREGEGEAAVRGRGAGEAAHREPLVTGAVHVLLERDRPGPGLREPTAEGQRLAADVRLGAVGQRPAAGGETAGDDGPGGARRDGSGSRVGGRRRRGQGQGQGADGERERGVEVPHGWEDRQTSAPAVEERRTTPRGDYMSSSSASAAV